MPIHPLDPEAGLPDPERVGQKGYGLALMLSLGMPVPAGFTIDVDTTRALRGPDDVIDGLVDAMARAREESSAPTCWAVRPGAARSAPGAMLSRFDVTDDPAAVAAAVHAVLASARHGAGEAALRAAGADPERVAVTVQRQVDGARDDASGAGVACSRDPMQGSAHLMGEYAPRSRGIAVTGGHVTGRPWREMPEPARDALVEHLRRLEARMRDAVEVEFVVEGGRIWLVQVRPLGRTFRASVRITVDLWREGILGRDEATARLDVARLHERRETRVEPDVHAAMVLAGRALARGLASSPGVATGALVLDPHEAVLAAARGESVVLARGDASSEDIPGVRAATGTLTASGGLTSHAAVVCRAVGRPCVTGCRALTVEPRRAVVRVQTEAGERVLRAGDVVTIDGARGWLYAGDVPSTTVWRDEGLEALLSEGA